MKHALKRLFRKREKVFVIGQNKTGTTSMELALRSLGYKIGNQVAAELLFDDWVKGRFDRIIDLCREADAFQDIPFALDGTYREMDKAFPGSKFILTVRSSAEEWFESVTRFHTKIVGKGRLPTAEDLAAFHYRAEGWFLRAHLAIFDIDESRLYHRDHYMAKYNAYNQRAVDYFKDRPNDFMLLNVGDTDAADRLCSFLGKPGKLVAMPHENSSRQ